MRILALWIRTAFLENMTHRMLSLVQTKTLEVGGVVPTGKSISVAVALRECDAVCGRVRDDASSGAKAKN